MMKSVLFFDPVCRQPYDTRTLQRQALGGTEASVTRIADAIGALVAQHNRTDPWGAYRPPQRIDGIEHVVLIRDARALALLRAWYPRARFYLWVHDQLRPGSKRARRLRSSARLLRELAVCCVCVSDSQRRTVEATLRSIGLADHVRAQTIYNPVADDLVPDGTPIDPHKLVFFSSPNKGLAYALDVFRALHWRMPALTLAVANPAYKAGRVASRDGVQNLGALPQQRIHAEVRSALCTFAPNFVIPETFGLVFAESKALGTPVLAHDCGAAAEVVDDPRQVLPVLRRYRAYETAVHNLPLAWRAGPARLADRLGLFEAYVERIRAWHGGGRPVVAPDPRFRLARVAQQWRELLQRDGASEDCAP